MSEQSGVMVKSGPALSVEQYREIQTVDDAIRVFQETFGADAIVRADEVLGDGFAIVENKDELVGAPMFLISWNFNLGSWGQFVSARGVARLKNGTDYKFVLNDGSQGVQAQLSDYSTASDVQGGLLIPRGLRKSEYGLDANNEPCPLNAPERVGLGVTYYLDTSK